LESYFTFNSKILFEVTKKSKNWLNWENRKKKPNKPNREKKSIKPIRILKKPTGSVQFQFYQPESKKTESNPNRKKTEPNEKKTEPNKKTESNKKNRAKLKKPSQTGKTVSNRFESIFVLKNRTKTCQFEPISVFFF
jgi:hypothetical protein